MAKSLSKKEWALLIERDQYCLHCGRTDALSPQHRRNRGMGGSTDWETNSSANLMVMCSAYNQLIEQNADTAETARIAGWKLRPWESTERPVLDRVTGAWYVLDDNFGREYHTE